MGGGFAMEAVLESAGPECVVPGQVTPLRLLGVKVCYLLRNYYFSLSSLDDV